MRMEILFVQSEIEDIAKKVKTGQRLDLASGVRLYQTQDLLTLGYLADLVRQRKNEDKAYYIINQHINHTNVCLNLCPLCAFGRKSTDPGAYTLTLAEIEAKVLACRNKGIKELHIVGGLNPALPLDYYVQMLRCGRSTLPEAVIQAFTAVEIDFLAQINHLTIREVLKMLMEAGLDSLPGGGAEIFSPRVRSLICPRKISGQRWLEIHAAAHRLGVRTNATMLYGHVETITERVEHLIRLRELQDLTGGFLAFIPLPFHPQNTQLKKAMDLSAPTGYDDLKTLAVARLMLDNFDHIKAFWIMLGPKLAQVALSFGVDDLDGTVREEKIAHEAGAQTAQYLPEKEIINLIKSAGRVPVERDTLYSAVSHRTSVVRE